MLLSDERVRKKRPKGELGNGARSCVNSGLEIRECQCLETHLNLRRDSMGRRRRIYIKRTTLLATKEAEAEEQLVQMEVAVGSTFSMILTRLEVDMALMY